MGGRVVGSFGGRVGRKRVLPSGRGEVAEFRGPGCCVAAVSRKRPRERRKVVLRSLQSSKSMLRVAAACANACFSPVSTLSARSLLLSKINRTRHHLLLATLIVEILNEERSDLHIISKKRANE